VRPITIAQFIGSILIASGILIAANDNRVIWPTILTVIGPSLVLWNEWRLNRSHQSQDIHIAGSGIKHEHLWDVLICIACQGAALIWLGILIGQRSNG
jgi:hypothetical protein